MEGMETMPKCLHISSADDETPLLQFLLMPPCSYLSCGISVGEQVFDSGNDHGLTYIYGCTIM